ncbi:NUDIX hydrolase domain-like protein [Pelagophyceae sp. CCMP2097]|nr:NUDIX hydrolase domain-like protein [Pelagophyceae sp. CCMP2097]
MAAQMAQSTPLGQSTPAYLRDKVGLPSEKSKLDLAMAGDLYDRIKRRTLDVSGIGAVDGVIDYTLVQVPRVLADGRRQLLLGHKKRGFGVGKINGFGGKFEVGESAEDCALRELREESGVVATSIRWRAQLLFTFRDSGKLMRVHVFEVTKFSGEPQETDEMRPEWFDVSAMPYSRMWHDDTFWMPTFLEGPNFEAWFDYAAGGEETNTVLEYQINKMPLQPVTP